MLRAEVVLFAFVFRDGCIYYCEEKKKTPPPGKKTKRHIFFVATTTIPAERKFDSKRAFSS
jgi:hypothetical protein